MRSHEKMRKNPKKHMRHYLRQTDRYGRMALLLLAAYVLLTGLSFITPARGRQDIPASPIRGGQGIPVSLAGENQDIPVSQTPENQGISDAASVIRESIQTMAEESLESTAKNVIGMAGYADSGSASEDSDIIPVGEEAVAISESGLSGISADGGLQTAEQCVTVTVAEGDCLWNLAEEYLGDGTKYLAIYELNKEQIGDDPNFILQGAVLTIKGAADDEHR